MAATNEENSILAKGTLIGLVGGGQLGMFFTQAAQKLGYRVCCFCNRDDEPAAKFADELVCAPFSDEAAIELLASKCDVVTYEFESIPPETLSAIDRKCKLFPPLNVVQTAQDRSLEKQFLKSNNIPTSDFVIVESIDDLRSGIKSIGCATVLKTARDGYDGKGQWKLSAGERDPYLEEVWAEVDGRKCTLEKLIDLDFEVSMIVAGDQTGNITLIGPVRNYHRNHILDTSWIDHEISDANLERIAKISNQVAKCFGLVSTLCVEFFVSREGEILVNEIAPRPHNSGHLTIDSFSHSQFDLQALAVSGHQLSKSTEKHPAVMVNLLGDLWVENTEPPFGQAEELLGDCTCRLHLYGKTEARAGRKMGHVTILGPTQQEAIEAARKYQNFLQENAAQKA